MIKLNYVFLILNITHPHKRTNTTNRTTNYTSNSPYLFRNHTETL